jgi:hypothetical protein
MVAKVGAGGTAADCRDAHGQSMIDPIPYACRVADKERTMTVAELIRAQADALPEDMQREDLDFLLFLRMKAAHAGRVSGADTAMLRFFGAAPEFSDRLQ